MRKLPSSIVCLILLLAPARAGALSTTTAFTAFVDGTQAGTLRFFFDSVIPGVACRYVAAWQSEDGRTTAQCGVDEEIWVGNQSCALSTGAPIAGFVENVGAHGCAGFDSNGQNTSVFLLMLGEGRGKLDGVIQFSAASSIPSAFEGVAGP